MYELMIILGVLCPALAAGIIGLWNSRHAGAVALGLGFIAGFIVIKGVPPVIPTEASQWLPIAAVLFLLLEISGVFKGAGSVKQWLLRTLLLLIIYVVMLLPAFQYDWEPLGGLLRVAAAVVLTLLFWAGIQRDMKQQELRPALLRLWLVAVGGSLLLVFAGSVVLAQLAGAMAAAVAALLIVVWWRGYTAMAASIPAVFTVLFGGLFVIAWYFAELPVLTAGLLAVAPMAGRLIPASLEQHWPESRRQAIRVLLLLIPIAVSLYIGVISTPSFDEYY
jgi:hypothetical protein